MDLSSCLPLNEKFRLVHVYNSPQRCRKLVFTSSSDKRLDAVSTHLFLLVHENVAVFALEVFVFLSASASTLFVSKADTTGFYPIDRPRLNLMLVTQYLLKYLIGGFTPVMKQVRICLFAKSDRQYLFLGSVNNARKHVLPDAMLVKWWCRLIDGLGVLDGAKCALTVPGITDMETEKYFPNPRANNWFAGDVFGPRTNDVWAVRHIPRFPDDPKSRFLDSLVAEKRGKIGLKQFWLEMQSRQEFLLGKSVGIISVQGDHHKNGGEVWIKPMKRTDVVRFKETLLAQDFSTLESTMQATKRLLDLVDNNWLEITGELQPQKKRPAEPAQIINTLGVKRKR